ncbi:hypothetical protein PENSPDRAFT_492636 [Peniophora sp. CONT]|nr:hypothetical protein PENSPDRAFT_492636 [Peniophora sp. CONT]
MIVDDEISESPTPILTTVPQAFPISEPASASLSQESSKASQLTSSDKLSDLPTPFAVPLPSRRRHHSLEETSASHSAPEIRRLANTNSPVIPQLGSASDGSLGRTGRTGTRVSFESDRTSLPATPRANASPRQNASPRLPASDSGHSHGHHFPSMALPFRSHSRKDSGGPESPRSRSRTSSPLRAVMDRLPTLQRFRSREEPWIAVDPFRFLHLSSLLLPHKHPHLASNGEPINCRCISFLHSTTFHAFHVFVLGVLPRSLYLHFLLRLPSLYFSRVARIFEDAELSRPDMDRVVELCMSYNDLPARARSPLPDPESWVPPVVSPALARFKRSWETFVEQLLREWKTLNLVSALLLSAILTMFQIPSAANDSLTRTAALISLISATMSVSYGCVYIVRFSTMRSMYRASKWADEARRAEARVWWNAWVLLALPAVWLAWSMIAFLVAIVAFVWRTGARQDPDDDSQDRELSQGKMLGPRIAITAVLVLGLAYFALVITTFSRYSSSRPRWWRETDFTLRSGETQSDRGRGRVRDDRSSARSRREREHGAMNGNGGGEAIGLGLRPPEKSEGDGGASASTSPYGH